MPFRGPLLEEVLLLHSLAKSYLGERERGEFALVCATGSTSRGTTTRTNAIAPFLNILLYAGEYCQLLLKHGWFARVNL